MADLAELEAKFKKADDLAQAGDEQARADAQVFADHIKVLRFKEIAGGASDDPTRKWSPFVPSGSKGADDPANFGAAEIAAGHPLTSFAVGAVRPVLGAAQMLGASVGGKRLQDELDRARKTQEPGVSEVADFAGVMASPVNLGLAKAMGPVSGPGARLGLASQGAVLGGAGGLLAEVTDPEEKEFWETKVGQGGAGATLGALLGPILTGGAGSLAHAYKSWIEPVLGNYSPRVRELVKERVFLSTARDPKQQAELLAALRGSKEIVPGSSPTAGQAAVPASSPEFAALQASAAKIRPDLYLQRTDQQSGAVLKQLESVGMTPEEIKAAETARTRTTKPMYDEAAADTSQPIWRPGAPWSTTMEGKDITGQISPLMQYLDRTVAQNPGNASLVRELSKIRKGLTDAGGAARTDPEQLMSVLDGIKQAMAHEDNKYILSELGLVKRRLSARLPKWRQAETTFSEMSKPITQGEVVGEVKAAATPTGGWQPGSGMPLGEDKTLKLLDKGFGMRSNDLTPEVRDKIQQVKDEFMRNAGFRQQAKLGAPSAPDPEKLGGTPVFNVLKREVMVMNAILKRLEGKVSEKIASEIAVEMLNPPGVADSLQKAMQRQAQMKRTALFLESAYKHVLPGGTETALGQ